MRVASLSTADVLNSAIPPNPLSYFSKQAAIQMQVKALGQMYWRKKVVDEMRPLDESVSFVTGQLNLPRLAGARMRTSRARPSSLEELFLSLLEKKVIS